MFAWLKRHFSGPAPARGKYRAEYGTVTRICKKCGKSFTLPENVQHWPDCCQACRAKYQPEETVTRVCRGCGQSFRFASSERRWPKYCPECQAKRRHSV